MTSLTTYLAEVSAREKAATLGPWHVAPPASRGMWPAIVDASGRWIVADWGEWMGWSGVEANSDLIAAARTDVPTLLAMVQAALKVADDLDKNAEVASRAARVSKSHDDMMMYEAEGEACREAAKDIRQALTTAKEAGR